MRTSHPILLSAGIGGMVGLSVALTIALLQPRRIVPDQVILALWPTSILGVGYNGGGSPLTEILVVVVVLGGNALIYATAAALIAGCVVGIKNIGRKDLRMPLSIKPRDER